MAKLYQISALKTYQCAGLELIVFTFIIGTVYIYSKLGEQAISYRFYRTEIDPEYRYSHLALVLKY
jgi:hypothetical protein